MAGGIIYGLGGVQPTLFVDVVTAAVGIGVLLLLPVRARPPHREQVAFLSELVDGLRYTASHRFFLWLIGLQATVILFIVGPNFLVPLLVTQKFGEGVWALTGIETSFQVGTICGGVAVFGPLSTVVGVGGVIAATGAATIAFALCAFLVSPTGRAELRRERAEAATGLASQDTP